MHRLFCWPIRRRRGHEQFLHRRLHRGALRRRWCRLLCSMCRRVVPRLERARILHRLYCGTVPGRHRADRLYRMRVLCCGSEGRVCVHCLGRHRLMFGLRRGAISWRPNVHGHLLYNLPRGSIAGFGRAGGLRALRERMAGFVGRNRVYRVQLPTGDCRPRQRPKYTLQSVQAPRDAGKGGVHAR